MAGKPNSAWMQTMIKKHGSIEAVREIQKAIGTKGGKHTSPYKGFGSNPELASKVGKIGGSISRRKKHDPSN